MVNNIVNATYTETYDLNTAVGELSLLGLHTPQAPTVLKNFRGFFMQYKKYKILGCDVRMVCASRQELDPIDVGLEAGKVDPRDVLNPILFKACTNDAMNTLLDKIYVYQTNTGGDSGVPVNSSVLQKKLTTTADLDAYYQLLADDTFRQFHPQAGLSVDHLVPMVHKVVTTQAIRTGFDNNEGTPYMGQTSANSWYPSNVPYEFPTKNVTFMSNGITPLPWFDTAAEYYENAKSGEDPKAIVSSTQIISKIPRCFVGAIVLPPAILQSLYFRMKIKWYIQFADFRPAWDLGMVAQGSDSIETGINGTSTGYFNLYHTPTKDVLPNEQSSFSTTESTEVNLVNEVPR